MQTRTFVILIALLMSGFTLGWKESDMIWWFYCPWDKVYTWNWVNIVTPWFIWQINVYNSWCIFLSLKILTFIGIVVACVWYSMKPETLYMSYTKDLIGISHNGGKSWDLQKWTLTEGDNS